ncbi:hypothetical protein FJZ27_00805, partial [Candidatus Peribacteria bacterium]|nr:hypothetical protein [Candidatus Peribacteria bacterium]
MGRTPKIPASIQELKKFLADASALAAGIGGLTREGKLDWIRNLLSRFSYDALSREDKGTLKLYLEKTTGYSRAQMTRLIAESRSAIRQASPVTEHALKTEMVRRPFACAWTVSAAALTLLVMVRGWGGSTTASLTVLSGDLERRISSLEDDLHGPRLSRILTQRTLDDGTITTDPLLLNYETIGSVDGALVRQNFVALSAEELERKVDERRALRELQQAFGIGGAHGTSINARDALQATASQRRAQRMLTRGESAPLVSQPIAVFPSYDVANEKPKPTPSHGSAPATAVARSSAIIDALGGGTDGQILMIENGSAVWRDMPFREQIRELAPHGSERTSRGGDGGRRSGGGGGGGAAATSTVTNTTTTITQTIDSAEWTDGGTDVYLTTTTDNVVIGATTADTKLEVVGTISGSVLYAKDSLRSSGSLVWEGAASGASLWISTFDGAGLTDCDAANTSKLLWDSTTKRFTCGTDQGGASAPTAGQGLSLSLANVFSLNSSFSGTSLEILGTSSGRILYGADQILGSGTLLTDGAIRSKASLRSSGTLAIDGIAYLNDDLQLLGGDITGANSAALDLGEAVSGDISVTGDFIVADNSFFGLSSSTGRFEFDDQTIDEFNILNANVGIGTATPAYTLDAVGSIHASVGLSSSGTLVWEGAASGASLWVSSVTIGGSLQGVGLTDCDNATTSKLLWDATTGRFSCGSDQGGSNAPQAGQGLTLNGSNFFSLSTSFSGTSLEILGTSSGRIL